MCVSSYLPAGGVCPEVLINEVPSGIHLDVNGITLPPRPNDLPTGQVAKVFAMKHVGPQAYRAGGPGTLTAVNVF